MEEYIDWQKAGYPDVPTQDVDINNDPHLNIDLTLENAVDDDFSFFALAHYSGPPGDADIDAMAGDVTGEAFVRADLGLDSAAMVELPDKNLSPQECWEIPAMPCANCSLAGYQCKLIREGRYKGYCTSCVALGNECSFGGFVSSSLTTPDIYQPTPWNAQMSNIISTDQILDTLQNTSTPDLPKTPAAPGEQSLSAQKPPGKVGARLSRESIRILRQWLSAHTRHPYPTEEEKEMLQRQTGLARTQITNYLANARRRGKVQPQRSTSPNVRSFGSSAMDIPHRKGTPMLEDMNPLQRWEHSPPEHEPASAIAIARAVTASTTVTSSSGQASPFSRTCTDDGSTRSIHGSSASSVGTSQGSSGSFASAYSHASRGSFGSFGRGRRRRRRRNAPKRADSGKTPLNPSSKTYQCTFCVADFKTKHDWQRHEKSLHLSLERWVCCTHGPRALRPDTGKTSCVFCGEPDASDAHIENHNFSACQDKTLNDRTFYRKDHLNQHLKLVHNVKYADWSMKDWKVATPEIRSRCGFCGIVMDTWSIRVDHLAEHFKTGYSMADWKGDWGFEAPVLNLVENSIPPYLIHNERNSPLPYVAGDSPPESPRNAYELIKLELAYYMVNRQGREDGMPTDEQLQVEACRIIFASEVLSLQGISSMHSWLRDLIMSSEPLAQQAKFGPLRGQAENRLAILKINGKDNLFEACPLENQLREFVKARSLLGLTAMDDELQQEACRTVGRMEEVSTNPSDAVANWVVRMINKSTGWLANFRQRAHLPRSEDLADARLRSTDPSTIDSTIYNYSRLERELGDYVDLQRTLGTEPSDADLQRQARIILYEFDDGWNQTAADNADWLVAFKRRHLQSKGKEAASDANTSTSTSFGTSSITASTNIPGRVCSGSLEGLSATSQNQLLKSNPYFLNDANCYRRLAKELGRFVASTTSQNNPNKHVPSDEELQHQARWILYDDDDPWNQTAADNAEWLQRFKRDVGIIKDGPGLPTGDGWSVQQGGSGFAPPYAFPKAGMAPFNDKVQVPLRDGAKPFEAEPAIANKFIETFTTRYQKPARIFCSRELEDGLVQFAEREMADTGRLPPDDAIRERAREILDMETTAADDPHLLGKFKTLMLEGDEATGGRGSEGASGRGSGSGSAEDVVFGQQQQLEPRGGLDLGMNISDAEINDIIQDMNFELDMEDVMETM